MTQTVSDEVALREPRLLVPGMQPLGKVAVDKQHPLARGLLCFALASKTGFVNCVSGKPLVATAGAVALPYRDTISANCNGSSQYFETAESFEVPVVFTLAAWTWGLGSTNSTSLVGLGSAGTTARALLYRVGVPGEVALFVGAADYSQFKNTISGADAEGATPDCYVGVYRANNDMTIYRNGADISATSTRTQSTFAGANLKLQINVYRNNTTLAFYGAQRIPIAAIWNRELKQDEVSRLYADPYQLLQPA